MQRQQENRAESVEFIQSLMIELRTLAKRADLDTIAYLLDMAVQAAEEAAEEIGNSEAGLPGPLKR